MDGPSKSSPQSPLRCYSSAEDSKSASEDEGKKVVHTGWQDCRRLDDALVGGGASAPPSRTSSMPVLPSEHVEHRHPSLARGYSETGWATTPYFADNPNTDGCSVRAAAASVIALPENGVAIQLKDGGHKGRANITRSVTEMYSQATAKKLQRAKSRKRRELRASQLARCVQKLTRAATIGYDYRVKMGDISEVVSFEDKAMFNESSESESVSEEETSPRKPQFPRDLRIAILIVGTRGDVQPFIAIGRRLKQYGHRVRLASHSNYREFVTSAGLEFYPLGGDPKVLAEYMVKNKGFLPGRPSEVLQQRKQLKAIINSLWPACTEADKESNGEPFCADAIIANPPCIAHAHVAERLEVPLHVFFTMPWTPTTKYPHPLARMGHLTGFDNWLSYAIVDNVMWLGMRDIVNDFRRKKLKLPPVSIVSGPNLSTARIPFGYIWSPSLAPKPKDWGRLIDVCGFCFLDQGSEYKPPRELDAWLSEGPPPIYIGFGSLPVEKPQRMTEIIVNSLKETKQRGIIQRGWGGLGELKERESFVYTLGDCPHDWLFPRCAAVVHHGGAGTTAAGLRAGKPTTVVPFFGDQPFWGARVHAEGVGPEPISATYFSQDKLVGAIRFMLETKTKEAAEAMAQKMRNEDGVESAVNAFHAQLPMGTARGKHSTDWMKPNRCGWFCGRSPVVAE